MKQALLAFAFVAGATTAQAHQLWINATQYYVDATAGEQTPITAGVVYIGWGHLFPADSLPDASRVGPTTLHLPGGTERALERSDEGFLTAPLTVETEGAYVLTANYESGFYTVYRDQGEVKHALSSKEGIDDVLTSLYFEMTGKALIQVGEPVSDEFSQPVGQRIEIIPLRNPYSLDSEPGAELPVRVLLEGTPVPGAAVTLYRAGHTPGDQPVAEMETDTDGEAAVVLDGTGQWMIVATARKPLRSEFEGKADEESYTATLTFGVPKHGEGGHAHSH
jgi:uncharacterized GH25 family protein